MRPFFKYQETHSLETAFHVDEAACQSSNAQLLVEYVLHVVKNIIGGDSF